MTRPQACRAGKLAVAGGAPAVSLAPPPWPIAGDLEVAWMEGVIRSGQWSWNGPHEQACAREFAQFIGAKYCLCLANGTVTLQCALQAVGVEPGDEVIVPGLTWVATAQAALDIGANVVLVDVDPKTMNIAPAAIEKAITKKTKAIVPVHLYGTMCDMDAIRDIARRRHLKVVEDVAHQHGSRWRNVGAGALGDVGSFSFQQSKVLTCGEGGAITTDVEEYWRTIHCLKMVGWDPEGRPGKRYGHNYRFTEMQAVLIRGGLRRLPEQTGIREERAQQLAERLRRGGGPLQVVKPDPRVTRQAYYALTLHYNPAAAGLNRAAYLQALAAEGATFGLPYPPVYRHALLNLYDRTSPVPFRDPKTIQNYAELRLSNVEKICGETGVVLMHPHLLGSEEYIDQIAAAVDKVNHHLAAARRAWEEKQKRKAANSN